MASAIHAMPDEANERMSLVSGDLSGGLHYSRDDTDPVQADEITYSNPHHQRVGPRWVRGDVVWGMPLGIVHIDPDQTKWANEFVVCYSLDGNDGRPE